MVIWKPPIHCFVQVGIRSWQTIWHLGYIIFYVYVVSLLQTGKLEARNPNTGVLSLPNAGLLMLWWP